MSACGQARCACVGYLVTHAAWWAARLRVPRCSSTAWAWHQACSQTLGVPEDAGHTFVGVELCVKAGRIGGACDKRPTLRLQCRLVRGRLPLQLLNLFDPSTDFALQLYTVRLSLAAVRWPGLKLCRGLAHALAEASQTPWAVTSRRAFRYADGARGVVERSRNSYDLLGRQARPVAETSHPSLC